MCLSCKFSHDQQAINVVTLTVNLAQQLENVFLAGLNGNMQCSVSLECSIEKVSSHATHRNTYIIYI